MRRDRKRTRYAERGLLYWLLLIYVVGIPNFVHFDSTGRTLNPINLSSIASVIETAVVGYLLAAVALLDRGAFFRFPVGISGWPWLVLAAQFVLSTFAEPTFRLEVASKTDIPLSLFFLLQWILAFILAIALASRTPSEWRESILVEVIGRASWTWVGMVWILLPIVPEQVFAVSGESTEVRRQLGGQLIHPGKLATIAGIAFFYVLMFGPHGVIRWAGCTIAIATIALTNSRTAEFAVLVVVLLYTLIWARNAMLRWSVIGLGGAMVVIGALFRDVIVQHIARGQSAQTLMSLDDRSRIWEASWEAIRLRPFLGYGYVVGARKALLDHWNYAHWIPPHAHNELIAAAMGGGLVACAMLTYVYACVLRRGFQCLYAGPNQMFLMVTFLLIFLPSFVGPVFTYKYNPLGALLVLCCIGILASRRKICKPRHLVKDSLAGQGEVATVGGVTATEIQTR